MKAFAFMAVLTWASLWLTPDQQAKRYLERGEFIEAARTFQDPMWQGVAWYRAGEFEEAAKAFARLDTAEANFNGGNALLMRGLYKEATASYDKALENRPGWIEAMENRDLAIARGKRVERTGADMGDQLIGADDIVFNENASNEANEGQDTEVAGSQALSNQEIQALWLRRVQTRPAQFLQSKFAYQYAVAEDPSNP
jgi:Ca-activated chloride channel family protein